VPTVQPGSSCKMVGTLRFAYPTAPLCKRFAFVACNDDRARNFNSGRPAES
jgi:hypothetical protein